MKKIIGIMFAFLTLVALAIVPVGAASSVNYGAEWHLGDTSYALAVTPDAGSDSVYEWQSTRTGEYWQKITTSWFSISLEKQRPYKTIPFNVQILTPMFGIQEGYEALPLQFATLTKATMNMSTSGATVKNYVYFNFPDSEIGKFYQFTIKVTQPSGNWTYHNGYIQVVKTLP